MSNDNKIDLKFKWWSGFEMNIPMNKFTVICLSICPVIFTIGITAYLIMHGISPKGIAPNGFIH